MGQVAERRSRYDRADRRGRARRHRRGRRRRPVPRRGGAPRRDADARRSTATSRAAPTSATSCSAAVGPTSGERSRTSSPSQAPTSDAMLTEAMDVSVGWALDHPAEAQLMFWRPIARWQPSPAAFEPAGSAWAHAASRSRERAAPRPARPAARPRGAGAGLGRAGRRRDLPAALQRAGRPARRRAHLAPPRPPSSGCTSTTTHLTRRGARHDHDHRPRAAHLPQTDPRHRPRPSPRRSTTPSSRWSTRSPRPTGTARPTARSGGCARWWRTSPAPPRRPAACRSCCGTRSPPSTAYAAATGAHASTCCARSQIADRAGAVRRRRSPRTCAGGRPARRTADAGSRALLRRVPLPAFAGLRPGATLAYLLDVIYPARRLAAPGRPAPRHRGGDAGDGRGGGGGGAGGARPRPGVVRTGLHPRAHRPRWRPLGGRGRLAGGRRDRGRGRPDAAAVGSVGRVCARHASGSPAAADRLRAARVVF